MRLPYSAQALVIIRKCTFSKVALLKPELIQEMVRRNEYIYIFNFKANKTIFLNIMSVLFCRINQEIINFVTAVEINKLSESKQPMMKEWDGRISQ